MIHSGSPVTNRVHCLSGFCDALSLPDQTESVNEKAGIAVRLFVRDDAHHVLRYVPLQSPQPREFLGRHELLYTWNSVKWFEALSLINKNESFPSF
jgi:hypothetical protein